MANECRERAGVFCRCFVLVMGQAFPTKCSKSKCYCQRSPQAEMAEEEARQRKEEEQRREARTAAFGAS